jgi:uncharacterized repeat protein (TIGR03806 family)
MLSVVLQAVPVLADPGLEQRFSNLTCLARPRPGIGPDAITTQRMFPYLTLSPPGPSEFTVEALLASPMVLRQSPVQAGIWYLVERSGLLLRIDDVAQTSAPFLDLRSKVFWDPLDAQSEGGMLGFAFDPAFETNGYVYVYYTAYAPGVVAMSTLSRLRSLDGGMTVDPGSETVLLTIPQATVHHHAGTVEFGPDGMLYVSVGEGGSPSLAQDKNSLLGSILRLDVSSASPYAIPPDNPYASGGGRPELWAKGLRNPYRFTFDSVTGELWVGDAGQITYEEVDLVVRGGNYGWPIREGPSCYLQCCTSPNLPECNTTGLIEPVYYFDHSTAAVCDAIIGGYVYRGAAFPELQGHYLFSNWCESNLLGLFSNPGVPLHQEKLADIGGVFRSFATDADGEIYVLRTREVRKLVRSTAPPPAPFPAHLSETGCVQAADPTLPAPGLIPYRVNAPLWSDGAAKDRWLGLPDGQTISVLPGGDWDLPIGTVLMKRFRLRGRPIETRLFMRHDDGGWAGYSYEWNDAGTDADLLPGAKSKAVGGQTWHFPSRDECMSCHTELAGYTLGPSTAQLNGFFYYRPTARWANQLDTFEHIGLLDAPADRSQRITTTSSPSLDVLARSYLQANCANCHAPGSPVPASIDLRYSTPLDEMHVCGALPGRGDLGVPGARLVTPGDPSKSIVSLRMHDLALNRMPPLATSIVDPIGTALVDAWIRSLEAAPDGSCVARPLPACSDGIDNDGDGLTDFGEDPGCRYAESPREDPACNDGLDNDGDGFVDFDGGSIANHGVPVGPADPKCPTGHQEFEQRACGLGAELTLVLLVLRRLRRA